MKRLNWRWWASFALFSALGFAWVVATPIFAAPDEPAHVVRAVGAGRGQLLGRSPVPGDVTGTKVEVTAPAIYKNLNVSCFNFHPEVSAECLDVSGPKKDTQVTTYVGHHPPEYYAAVGFLSRWKRPGAGQVLVMRALGALAIAALLASCLETLRRLSVPTWAGTGFAIAVTPMVPFLAGAVSPSGIEVASAAGVWVHGAVLVNEAPDTVDSRIVDRFGLAVLVLASSRSLSPVWLGVMGLVLLILATRAGLRAIVSLRRIWAWGAALGASLVFYAWWYFYADPFGKLVGTPEHGSTGFLLRASFGKSVGRLHQMIAVFGWLDTPAPEVTFLIWVLALGGLAALVLAVGTSRFAWALLAAVAASVVLPVIVEAAGAGKYGFIWQGRYTLPLAVGVPILAGIGVASASTAAWLHRRLAFVVVAGLLIAQFLAFGQALRRYSVGAHGSIWFFSSARWDPPLPAWLLVFGYGAVMAVTLWWIALAPSRLIRAPAPVKSEAMPREAVGAATR